MDGTSARKHLFALFHHRNSARCAQVWQGLYFGYQFFDLNWVSLRGIPAACFFNVFTFICLAFAGPPIA